MVPYDNLKEAHLIPDMKVIGVADLQEMIRYVSAPDSYKKAVETGKKSPQENSVDFCEIHGQESLKRAVEIAVSGFHNLLMIGPQEPVRR